jgi:hypothetical protein
LQHFLSFNFLHFIIFVSFFFFFLNSDYQYAQGKETDFSTWGSGGLLPIGILIIRGQLLAENWTFLCHSLHLCLTPLHAGDSCGTLVWMEAAEKSMREET